MKLEPTESAIDAKQITGVILAGGRGRRLSADGAGADKALIELNGRPLIAHAIERLRDQVGVLLINANGDPARFRCFDVPVIADAEADFAGPLAGMATGLAAARTEWIACVPCDCPRFPLDLVRQLAICAARAARPAALARTASGVQPVFALLSKALREPLTKALARGERKAERWFAGVGALEVQFDDEAAFVNINTRAELSALQR